MVLGKTRTGTTRYSNYLKVGDYWRPVPADSRQ